MRMHFYVSLDMAGNYHVQNAIMGMMGQHHVHTPSDYIDWSQEIPDEDITLQMDCSPCSCGMKPGQGKSGR